MKIKLSNGITITGDNLVIEINDPAVKIVEEKEIDTFSYGVYVEKKEEDTISYGIHIILKDGTYISKDEYDKEKHEARGILIHTEKLCHELSLFDHKERMTWDEAVKHSIPSKEQWEEIANYIGEIEKILKLTGGDTLKYKWHWSSTEFSSYYSWRYYGGSGGLLSNGKGSFYRVRPFVAFSL